MRIKSGEFGVERRHFGGRSSLAGIWRRDRRPRLRASGWAPSGAPFGLQVSSYGSIEGEEEAGGVSLHRRCAVAGEDDQRVACTRWSSRATTRPRRVQARGSAWGCQKNWKKSGKILEKKGKIIYGGLCHQMWIWPSRCLGFRTDQSRFA